MCYKTCGFPLPLYGFCVYLPLYSYAKLSLIFLVFLTNWFVKIKVDGKKLNTKLSVIETILRSAPNQDMYKYIKIEVSGCIMVLTALNLTTCVIDLISDVSATGDEVFYVDAATFINMVRKVDGEIAIELKGNSEMRIKYERGARKMTWLRSVSFPTVYSRGLSKEIEIPASSFADVLRRASMFTKKEEFRPQTEVVSIDVDKENVNTVSTDMFVLYIHKSENRLGVQEGLNMCIQKCTQDILYMYLAKSDATVFVSSNDRCTFFRFGDVVVYNVNINARYFDWRSIEAKFRTTYTVKCNIEELKVMIDKCYTDPKLLSQMLFKDGLIWIKTEDPGFGYSIYENIDGEMDCTGEYSYSISLQRFANIVRNIKTDKIIMEVSDGPGIKIFRIRKDSEDLNDIFYMNTYFN